MLRLFHTRAHACLQFLVLSGAMLLVHAPLAMADLGVGLIAYYPFNGSADDDSGSGHHGTVSGATLVADRNGQPNSAYQFDGVDDQIVVADAADLRLHATDYSIASWVYLDSYDPSFQSAIATKRSAGIADGWFFSLTGQAGAPTFPVGALYFQLSGGVDPNINSTATIPIGQWHHVAVTYSNSTGETTLWIDGRVAAAKTLPTANALTASDLFIGRDSSNPGYYFHGILDEIRIYDRALSGIEVFQASQADQSEIPSGETNVLWYAFQNHLTGIWLGDDGASRQFSSSLLEQSGGLAMPPSQQMGLTMLQDGGLIGSTISGGNDAPFDSRIFYIAAPPLDGSVATAQVLGTMPSGIGIEALYTDCSGRLYAMDTGSHTATTTGNRLLRFTGDVLAGDLSFTVVSDLSGSVPDIDDMAPGLDAFGNVEDRMGLAIDSSTAYSVDYETGAFNLIGATAGTYGIHAMDGSLYADATSRIYVLSSDVLSGSTLFEIDPDSGATIDTLGTGPNGTGLTGPLPTCATTFAVPTMGYLAQWGLAALLLGAGLVVVSSRHRRTL